MRNDTATALAEALAPAELAAWRGFVRTHAELIRALDAELLAAHGLPLSSYEVLVFLAGSPGGRMRMSELADSVLLSRSGLSRLADRLEKEGLIERQTCPTDQRGLYAAITEEGRRLFEEARQTHLAGVRARFVGRLTEDERRTLAELWERLLS